MNYYWDEDNPEPVQCMGVKKAKAIVNFMCTEWWAEHPEDRHLPWQAVLYKVLRASAMHGGYSMYVCHSEHGMLISDFAMIDRTELSHPFHG